MTSSCICAEVLIMNRPRLPRDRVPYSAIIDRPALVLPGDARMVVWTIVNVEDWGIERPMPRTVLTPPMGQPLLPDLPKDRKSTRLNSSHLGISYAVFCLKKKNRITRA